MSLDFTSKTRALYVFSCFLEERSFTTDEAAEWLSQYATCDLCPARNSCESPLDCAKAIGKYLNGSDVESYIIGVDLSQGPDMGNVQLTPLREKPND